MMCVGMAFSHLFRAGFTVSLISGSLFFNAFGKAWPFFFKLFFFFPIPSGLLSFKDSDHTYNGLPDTVVQVINVLSGFFFFFQSL